MIRRLIEINGGLGQSKQKNKQPQSYNQNVSCLYADSLYKSSEDHLIEKMHIEKYRHLYEQQKREKLQLLREFQNLGQSLSCMREQKAILDFAYRTLQAKKTNQQWQDKRSKQKRLLTKLRNSSQASQDMPIESQLEDNNIYDQQMKIHNTVSKIITQNDRSLIHTKNEDQLSEEDMLLLQNTRMKGIQDDCFEQEMEKIINQKEEKIQQLQQHISKQQAQIQKLTIATLQNQSFRLEIINIQRVNLQNQNIIHQTNTENATLKQNLNQLREELQRTLKQYEQKQKKEERQLMILQKFGQELQISDNKIREFMNEEFGEDMSYSSVSQKIAYKEKLSYLLHLTKKKQALYQTVVTDLKQTIHQLQFSNQIMEQKSEETLKIHKKLIQIAASGDTRRLNQLIESCIK